MLPSVRYGEVLLAPALALFTLFEVTSGRRPWRDLATFVGAAAVPALLLAFHNQLAFGAFWKTAYSLSSEQSAFSVAELTQSFLPVTAFIFGMGLGLLLPLGAYGLVTLCMRPETRQRGIVLVALVAPLSLLYLAYQSMPGPGALRFFLPTFPAYVIAGVWVLKQLTDRWRTPGIIATALVVLAGAAWGIPSSIGLMNMLETRNDAIAQVSREVERNIEPGSIVIAQDGYAQYLDVLGTWRIARAELLTNRRGGGMSPLEFLQGMFGDDLPFGPDDEPLLDTLFAEDFLGRGVRHGHGRRERGFPGPPPFLADADDTSLTDRPGRRFEAVEPTEFAGLPAQERAGVFAQEVATWAGAERSVYWLGDARSLAAALESIGCADSARTVARIRTDASAVEPPGGPFPTLLATLAPVSTPPGMAFAGHRGGSRGGRGSAARPGPPNGGSGVAMSGPPMSSSGAQSSLILAEWPVQAARPTPPRSQ